MSQVRRVYNTGRGQVSFSFISEARKGVEGIGRKARRRGKGSKMWTDMEGGVEVPAAFAVLRFRPIDIGSLYNTGIKAAVGLTQEGGYVAQDGEFVFAHVKILDSLWADGVTPWEAIYGRNREQKAEG